MRNNPPSLLTHYLLFGRWGGQRLIGIHLSFSLSVALSPLYHNLFTFLLCNQARWIYQSFCYILYMYARSDSVPIQPCAFFVFLVFITPTISIQPQPILQFHTHAIALRGGGGKPWPGTWGARLTASIYRYSPLPSESGSGLTPRAGRHLPAIYTHKSGSDTIATYLLLFLVIIAIWHSCIINPATIHPL